MKIPSTSSSNKEKFYDNVITELNKVPFGTYTKKDLECMILHAMFSSEIVKTRKSRELANLLEINETKLKNILLDVRYKYQPDNQIKNVHTIIKEIFANKLTKVVNDNGFFIFAIEDPVQKLDFEQAMKDVGYFSDSSFNKEIVKVKDFALVAFLFRHNNNDNTFNDIQKFKKAATANEKDLISKIDLKKTWIEIGKDMLDITKNTYEKVEVLRKLAIYLTTGKFT